MEIGHRNWAIECGVHKKKRIKIIIVRGKAKYRNLSVGRKQLLGENPLLPDAEG